MVHALHEMQRILVPGGYLIDLRPFIEKPPLEIVSDGKIIPAGFVDTTDGYLDDLAANDAIDQVTEAGIFIREQDESFNVYQYWDSFTEFTTYMDERSSIVLPPETRALAAELVKNCAPDARMRTCRPMIITRYRKPHSPG
jgi:hypothetical protein